MEAVGDRDGRVTTFQVRIQKVQTTEHGVWGVGYGMHSTEFGRVKHLGDKIAWHLRASIAIM
jgi:hypothetical protein